MAGTRHLTAGGMNRRLGVGAAAQFVGIFVQQIAKFLTNWLIARYLGASVLGLFNYSLTFWSAVEMSFTGGLIRTVMRYLPHHLAREEESRAAGVLRLHLLASWVGGAVLGVMMYALAEPLARQVLDQPEAAASLRILALAMPLAAVSGVAWATARSLGSLLFIVHQFMLLPAALVVGIPVVAALKGGTNGLSWAFVASYLLPLLPLLLHHRRLTAFLPAPEVKPVLRACAGFFAIACLMWFAEYIARNLDVLLVGRLRSPAETGVYVIASRTSTLPSMVLVAFNAFFSPTVSALYASGRLEELRATYRRASLWILMVSAPALGILMTLAQPVMIFFGREFVGGALALWLLCLGQLVNTGAGLINVVLSMADRQRTVLYCNLAGVAVSAGLCLLWIPRYGILGAAGATTVFLVLVPVALCVLGYRSLGVNPLSGTTAKPLAAALVAGLIVSPLAPLLPGTLLQLLGGTALYLALYAGGMVALGEKQEARRALQALREAAQRRKRPADEATPGEGLGE